MAPVTADSNGVKSDRCSNPSRKVRVIGKIRGLTDRESEKGSGDLKPWITVKKPKEDGSSEKYTVFLESQSTSRKDGYELDCCYEPHEQNDDIYSREIQPLVTEVFNGRNASIIALGAKGSGKTYTIQGSQEQPGLAVIAMSEILTKAKELGKAVSISLYELTQEHVKDLLNSDHPVVQVMEDAQGKINLRGLSEVPVKSISEFCDIYFSHVSLQNNKKLPIDQSRNNGLMVHISPEDNKLKAKPANKINFVDLAGYEDPRKSSRDGTTLVDSYRNNKTLYALLKVVNAINNNEIRVPYRESKLSRILQDSLGGASHVLLLTCLNPCFCQDSLNFISLVSPACRSIKPVLTDSTNRSQSSAKVKVISSLESGKTLSASLSAKKQIVHSRVLSAIESQSSAKRKVISSLESGKTSSASLNAKKQIGHSRVLSARKASCNVKGRILFDDVKRDNHKQNQSEDTSTQKSKILPDIALVVAPLSLEEAPQDTSNSTECSPCTNSTVNLHETLNVEESESQSISEFQNMLLSDPNDKLKMDLPPQSGVSPCTNLNAGVQLPSEGASTFQGSNSVHIKDKSQSIIEKIMEIKNTLIHASTPLTIKMPEDLDAPCTNEDNGYEIPEPKTPMMELNMARHCSPGGTFSNRTSGMKNYLVKEHINFLNSANKEELKTLKGIGEKRATYILQLRENTPEPFKTLNDLGDIGLSAKQIKDMMKHVAGDMFN